MACVLLDTPARNPVDSWSHPAREEVAMPSKHRISRIEHWAKQRPARGRSPASEADSSICQAKHLDANYQRAVCSLGMNQCIHLPDARAIGRSIKARYADVGKTQQPRRIARFEVVHLQVTNRASAVVKQGEGVGGHVRFWLVITVISVEREIIS